MFSASGAGTILPAAYIIKCYTENVDQQGALQVIDKLHKTEGYTAGDGWVSLWWEGDVETKTLGSRHFRRNYLLHTGSGEVIWSQHNAYMDSCGMSMWIDLVLGPYKEKLNRKKMLVVMDSHSSHLTPSVLAMFAK